MSEKGSVFPLFAVMAGIRELTETGKAAWQKGLMTGFSGNMSLRIGQENILLTASGVSKGSLVPEDFVVLKKSGEVEAGVAAPSSEAGLHRAIYDNFNECLSIVHTHPSRMQALELLLAEQQNTLERAFSHMKIFEAAVWGDRIAIAERAHPGSAETANAAIKALNAILPGSLPCGVWLPAHGLCALGKNANDALAFTEELEHLAGIRLLCS